MRKRRYYFSTAPRVPLPLQRRFRFSAATTSMLLPLQRRCRAVFPRLDLTRAERRDAALAEVKRTAADGTRTTDWKQPVVVARLSPYTVPEYLYKVVN